jgi:putative transposase
MRMNCVSNNGEVAKVPARVPAGGFRADEDLRQRVGVGTGAGDSAQMALQVEREGAWLVRRGDVTGSGRVGPGGGGTAAYTAARYATAQTGAGAGVDGGPAEPEDRFFQRCLAANRATTAEARRDNRVGVYEQIRSLDGLQGGLTIERMCWLSKTSRASYYRQWREREPDEEEMSLRAEIQAIALEHPGYGEPRTTAELRRRGWIVNPKRVARLRRLDNLVAIGKRRFRPVTTTTDPARKVYLNVAARLEPRGANQLWVADITYIRLRREFVYLAVVLDSWSRKVIGWNLGRTLKADLPLGALRQAIETRKPPAGLVHHSDRGVQYASDEYLSLLAQHHIVPSMSRAGNPYDNARCESFMKTLKTEEIHAKQYADLDDLRRNLETFLNIEYNRQRLHSALGYRPPEEFEAATEVNPSAAASMSFLRQEEIYPDAIN